MDHLISNHPLNYVRFSSVLMLPVPSVPYTRAPCSLPGCVCGMWFGFLPIVYSEWENKAPQCALFSTFLGPDISLAAGRTLPQQQNGCVQEGAPLTQAVWLADPVRVGSPPTLTAEAPTTIQSKGCFTYHMLFCSINQMKMPSDC